MKKYIITGGAGFIGSHIAETLSNQGHQVIVMDSLRTGFTHNINSERIQFVKGDVRNKDLVKVLTHNADAIFHLAALVSVPESLSKIYKCVEINTLGTLNVLKAAKDSSGCKVVFSSSAANYGDNPSLPKVESMIPEPMTPYSVTKLDGEYYLKMYTQQWNIPTVSLRYFNVFGPRQNPKSSYAAAVPIFINKALLGEPLTIYGDGLQTRDFIYVKDVVKANLLASSTGSDTYNVALGQSTSILELAEKIIGITNSRSKIQFLQERPGDIKHSVANPKKFNDLGFKPDYTLEKGLEETIEYYHNQLLIKQ